MSNPPGLVKLAAQLLEECNGNLNKARKRAEEFLWAETNRETIKEFLLQAFVQTLENNWRGTRRLLANAERSAGHATGLQRAYNSIAATLFDWPLSVGDGLKLGDAKADDLSEWINRRKLQLETELTDLEWIKKIYRRLKAEVEGAKVRDIFNTAELAKLREQSVESVQGGKVSV